MQYKHTQTQTNDLNELPHQEKYVQFFIVQWHISICVFVHYNSVGENKPVLIDTEILLCSFDSGAEPAFENDQHKGRPGNLRQKQSIKCSTTDVICKSYIIRLVHYLVLGIITLSQVRKLYF